MFARLIRPIVQLREGESTTVLLMFLYSFLAMAGYNMIKPVTRGLVIETLGAENLPWIQFGAGIVIGFIMQGYTRTISMAPRRWMIPLTLGSIVLAMSVFYLLFGRLPNNRTVAVGQPDRLGAIDSQQFNIRQRIDEGVRSHRLSPREADRLLAREQAIEHREAAYRSDGVVTPQERRDLRVQLTTLRDEVERMINPRG